MTEIQRIVGQMKAAFEGEMLARTVRAGSTSRRDPSWPKSTRSWERSIGNGRSHDGHG